MGALLKGEWPSKRPQHPNTVPGIPIRHYERPSPMSRERYHPSLRPLDDPATDHWNRYAWALEDGPLGRVLDAGCGAGYGSSLLASDKGTISVTAVDNSVEALFSALNDFSSPKVSRIQADLTHFANPHRFDTIIAYQVLEHLYHPDNALLKLWILCHSESVLFVSITLDEEGGGNLFHHKFDLSSARGLCSRYFSIRAELHQDRNIAFKLVPNPTNEVLDALGVDENATAVFLQAGNEHNGAYQSSVELLQEMHQAGLPAFILTDRPSPVSLLTGYQTFYAPIYHSFASAETLPQQVLESILSLILLLKPAILYSTHEFLSAARFVADYTKLPLLCHLRGMLDGHWYAQPANDFTNRFQGLEVTFLANSQSSLESYKPLVNTLGRPIVLIANQINKRLLERRFSHAIAEKLSRFKGRRTMISYVASMRCKEKGLDDFLAVFEELHREASDGYCACIVADELDGFSDHEILTWARSRGIPDDSLYLSPSIDEVASIYKVSDWVVVPSKRTESFGRVAFEAASLGANVCCYDMGHLATAAGANMFRVEFGNTNALAECIRIRRGRSESVEAPTITQIGRLELLQKVLGQMQGKRKSIIKAIIVVAAFRSRRLLSALLTSIARTLCSLAEVHLVVVTGEVAKKEIGDLLDQFSQSFRTMCIEEYKADQFSFAEAVNIGFSSHRAIGEEAVLLFNDDVELTATAAARIGDWGQHGKCIIGPVSNSPGGFHQQGSLRERDLAERPLTKVIRTPYRLAAFCLWLPTQILEDLGGFDTRFDGYGCEDTDFCLRAALNKVPLLVDPECFVYHAGGQTYNQEFDKIKLSELRARSVAAFLDKHRDICEYDVPLNVEEIANRRL
jgi:2-polyprenyl-3-methyl-5-hydroxy-6-metoxy-1,4-benzoquinol methylase